MGYFRTRRYVVEEPLVSEEPAVIEEITKQETEALGTGSFPESESFELPVLTETSHMETATEVSADEVLPEKAAVAPIKEATADATKPSNQHIAKSYKSQKEPVTY